MQIKSSLRWLLPWKYRRVQVHFKAYCICNIPYLPQFCSASFLIYTPCQTSQPGRCLFSFLIQLCSFQCHLCHQPSHWEKNHITLLTHYSMSGQLTHEAIKPSEEIIKSCLLTVAEMSKSQTASEEFLILLEVTQIRHADLKCVFSCLLGVPFHVSNNYLIINQLKMQNCVSLVALAGTNT